MLCLMYSQPIKSDDVRDALLETACLMIRDRQRRRKVRSKECEGVITTQFTSLLFVDIAGIQFNAIIEHDEGKNEVSFLVRDQDLRELAEPDEVAWITLEDLLEDEIPAEKRRPNPIRRVIQHS